MCDTEKKNLIISISSFLFGVFASGSHSGLELVEILLLRPPSAGFSQHTGLYICSMSETHGKILEG